MFENKFTWYLYNVVTYDGVEARVHKIILREDFENDIDEQYVSDYIKAYTYEEKVIKIDRLYELSFDNIVAFNGMIEWQETFDIFIQMYFPYRD